MPINFGGAPYPSNDESYFYSLNTPSSTVAYMPLGYARIDNTLTLTFGTNNVPATMLPFLMNKPFQKISVSHTAGTHPTASLELAIYNMGTDGRPSTLVEKGSVSLTGIGIKTVTLSSPKTLNGIFYASIRPSIGNTEWVATSGTGTLALASVGIGSNSVINQIFGALNPSTFSNFHGCFLYSYQSFSTFPISLVNSGEVILNQAANAPQWIPVIHN